MSHIENGKANLTIAHTLVNTFVPSLSFFLDFLHPKEVTSFEGDGGANRR